MYTHINSKRQRQPRVLINCSELGGVKETRVEGGAGGGGVGGASCSGVSAGSSADKHDAQTHLFSGLAGIHS